MNNSKNSDTNTRDRVILLYVGIKFSCIHGTQRFDFQIIDHAGSLRDCRQPHAETIAVPPQAFWVRALQNYSDTILPGYFVAAWWEGITGKNITAFGSL